MKLSNYKFHPYFGSSDVVNKLNWCDRNFERNQGTGTCTVLTTQQTDRNWLKCSKKDYAWFDND